MSKGWFLIDRKFFDHFLWTENREYSKAEAWIDLIAQARYSKEPAKEMINGQLVTWERGQLIAAIRFLKRRWKWKSNTKVEGFLKLLEKEDMIIRENKTPIGRITICNYDTYQEPKDGDKDTKKTSRGQTKDKTVKKEENKGKEGSVGSEESDIPSASDPEKWRAANRIADNLLKAICEYDHDHRYNRNPPSDNAMNKWATEIDRALRLDGRTESQMNKMIDHIFKRNEKNSAFWAGNIESGNKLREKFDKIKNQIRADSIGTSNLIGDDFNPENSEQFTGGG